LTPLICIRRVDQTAILNVSGDIDLASSPVVRKILMREVRENRTPIVVCNLTEVGYIDSAGIASLVEGLRASREIGSRVILCSLSPVVREVLRLSKLLAVFEIYEDENQALVSRNPRVEREANGAGRRNRGGGYIGPGLDWDSCNPCVPRCLFYLVCPFPGKPLRSGSCRLTSDGSDDRAFPILSLRSSSD
jgi:anti-sigma B factor antagonist